MKSRANLRVIKREEPSTEELLAMSVPELIAAEKIVARLKAIVAAQSRALARERGVSFIREERIRQEFGQ